MTPPTPHGETPDNPQASPRVIPGRKEPQMSKTKEITVRVCSSGIIVLVDRSLISAAMSDGVVPLHAFGSTDEAIAFIRKQIMEARTT